MKVDKILTIEIHLALKKWLKKPADKNRLINTSMYSELIYIHILL